MRPHGGDAKLAGGQRRILARPGSLVRALVDVDGEVLEVAQVLRRKQVKREEMRMIYWTEAGTHGDKEK